MFKNLLLILLTVSTSVCCMEREAPIERQTSPKKTSAIIDPLDKGLRRSPRSCHLNRLVQEVTPDPVILSVIELNRQSTPTVQYPVIVKKKTKCSNLKGCLDTCFRKMLYLFTCECCCKTCTGEEHSDSEGSSGIGGSGISIDSLAS